MAAAAEEEFFPFDPLALRLLAVAVAVAAVAVAGWATAQAVGTVAPRGWIRAGASCGLALAAAWLAFKLRPRRGWGVRVGPWGLDVARLANGRLCVPWQDVKRLERRGKDREQLLVVLGSGACITVPARLFRARRDFDALVGALERRLPPPEG